MILRNAASAGVAFMGPVLVLAPHPDDEIGCGGLIARLTEEGHEVHHYFFSDCKESIETIGHTVDSLLLECQDSCRILGINPENCGGYRFPVRYFPDYRQNILEMLTELKHKIDPNIVLVPNKSDIHQDHGTIASEAIRAFKHCSILGYELPWNMLESRHDCLVKLEERHLCKKLDALAAYKTQSERHYANRQFFESLARIRGVQARTEFAECFEVIRLVF